MDWLYYVILLVLLLCGVALTTLTLPGNWLTLLAALGYGAITHWRHVGWKTLVALLVLALVAEAVEFLAAGKAAKRVGGSVWGSVGAIVGGLLGGVLLTGLIPIVFPLNTIVGLLAGTFIGASGAELLAGKKVGASARIGGAATKGRLYGTLLKLGFGIVMALVAVVAALPT